jgi:hypothetical protein
MRRWAAIACCALVSFGCAREFVGRTLNGRNPTRQERGALQRAAVDLSCDPEELVVGPIGASAYHVEGCGRAITYLCLLVPGGYGGSVACSPSQPVQPTVQPVYVTTTTASTPPPQVIIPPPSGPEVAAARAAIDAHAAGVLACSGNTAVAVDANWDANGTLAVTVVGHAGTPEEECVRAALAGTIVSPPGAGGHVMHPIEPR